MNGTAVAVGGAAAVIALAATSGASGGGPTMYPPNTIATGNLGSGGGPIHPAPGTAGYYDDPGLAQSKLDLMLNAAFARFDQMSAAEKMQAADYLNNKLGISPPLRGNEDWQTITQTVSGYAGAAACNAIPGIGTAVSGLCGIAAAYVGVELEQWLEGNLDDLKSWVRTNVGDVVSDALDSAVGWFKGLF